MPTFKERAIADMRIPGHAGSYATSYALNDDRSLQMPSTWTQASRAMLAMGRYPYTPPGGTCEAFTGVNPDVGGLSWVASVEPGALTAVWDKLAFWGEVTLSTTFGNAHAPGYTGNTRVAVWDCEAWVRQRSTGLWLLVRKSSDLGGMHYRPDYAGTNGNIQFRTEPSGYLSFRPLSSINPAYSAHYWWNVPVYPSINSYEVTDVVVAQKVALVLHDSAGTDDREFSRFMLRTGADYYPTSNQAFSNNPGVGQSRTKFIRAQWPNWEWGVMHTMTEAQINGSGALPPTLASLQEGIGQTGGGSDPSTENPPYPSVCKWSAIVADAGPPVEYAWDELGVAATAVTGGVPPILRRR